MIANQMDHRTGDAHSVILPTESGHQMMSCGRDLHLGRVVAVPTCIVCTPTGLGTCRSLCCMMYENVIGYRQFMICRVVAVSALIIRIPSYGSTCRCLRIMMNEIMCGRDLNNIYLVVTFRIAEESAAFRTHIMLYVPCFCTGRGIRIHMNDVMRMEFGDRPEFFNMTKGALMTFLTFRIICGGGDHYPIAPCMPGRIRVCIYECLSAN